MEMYTLKREVESRERALILYDVEQLEESTAIRETANFMFRTLQMTKEEARRITVNEAYRIGARRGNRPRPMRIVVKSRDEVGVILRQATKYNKGRLVSRDQPLVIRQGRKRLMTQYNKLRAANVPARIVFPAALEVQGDIVVDLFPGYHDVQLENLSEMVEGCNLDDCERIVSGICEAHVNRSLTPEEYHGNEPNPARAETSANNTSRRPDQHDLGLADDREREIRDRGPVLPQSPPVVLIPNDIVRAKHSDATSHRGCGRGARPTFQPQDRSGPEYKNTTVEPRLDKTQIPQHYARGSLNLSFGDFEVGEPSNVKGGTGYIKTGEKNKDNQVSDRLMPVSTYGRPSLLMAQGGKSDRIPAFLANVDSSSGERESSSVCSEDHQSTVSDKMKKKGRKENNKKAKQTNEVRRRSGRLAKNQNISDTDSNDLIEL